MSRIQLKNARKSGSLEFYNCLISWTTCCLMIFISTGLIADDEQLVARGEHRIEVQNFGRKNPEIPIDIMQANYYDEHHGDYMIRIEDLNKTLNREINEDINREYSQWFENEWNRRAFEQEQRVLEEDQALQRENQE